MHFAAESTLDPLKYNLDPTIFGSIFARLEFFLANLLYYHNITSNTLVVLEAVADLKQARVPLMKSLTRCALLKLLHRYSNRLTNHLFRMIMSLQIYQLLILRSLLTLRVS
ncbi:unnamed protein product [Brassica oleracea]|uniref:Uncharacterized protein n=1 Tax=Brassica oleracea TaxID=3712 RepID=A0A3P6EJK7_BRAOL|nr:unnamed protein product [Brassica oleracea]